MIEPSMIWLVDGPAHFWCWVDKVKTIPVTKPEPFDPKAIYHTYKDAMMGTTLAPRHIYNRFRKRQLWTFGVDKTYHPPEGMSYTPKP